MNETNDLKPNFGTVKKVHKHRKTFIMYIIAFSFYIIGIIIIVLNYRTPNAMGMLYGAPFAIIGMICGYVGYSSGHFLKPDQIRWAFKFILVFGLILLFISLIPIIGLIIFVSVGGW